MVDGLVDLGAVFFLVLSVPRRVPDVDCVFFLDVVWRVPPVVFFAGAFDRVLDLPGMLADFLFEGALAWVLDIRLDVGFFEADFA